jgi:DNA-binding transcriptional LysR family regulator
MPLQSLPPNWFLRARLKLRHLQLFMALDEHRNLHRAAASLNLSQPAASKLLSDFEDALGFPLFDRHARGIEPNWYGELMIRHARVILSELAVAGSELAALQAGHSGKVTVGTVMAPAVELIVPAVDTVRRGHPGLQIAVDVDTSPVLIDRLRQGQLDFAIARIPADTDPSPFAYEEIGDEELCFVCRSDHPLAALDQVTLEDLVGKTWVLQPRGSLLRRLVHAMFRGKGLPIPTQVVESASVVMSMAMIDKTDALSVTARALADLYCSTNRFSILKFKTRFSVEPYGLVLTKDHPLSPGARTLLAAVRAALPRPAAKRLVSGGPIFDRPVSDGLAQ